MSGLNEKSRDPSMEDVLASIRKIIAEELDAAHHASMEDIGPLDHNLPWAERQTNKLAKKTPPVLPIQTVSEPETNKNADVSLGSVGEGKEPSPSPSAQAGAMTIADTVVSDEQRAAVAEFEEAVTALSAHEPIAAELHEEMIVAASASSETEHQALEVEYLAEASALDASLSVSPESLATNLSDHADETEGANHWSTAPLPFEGLQFAASGEEGMHDAMPVVANVDGTVVPDGFAATMPADVSQGVPTNLYSDFLDAQKPQLNVKIDLSFLDQKFNDPAATGKGTELPVHQEPLDVSAPPARSASLDPAPDFSVFGSDRTHKPLPPFIPANEPSYSSLVSQRTTDALLSSLRQLTEATRPPEPVAAPQEKTLAPRLDEFMADVLRPLLSSWLDTNLERIVDQAVRDEIAKVTKKIRP